MRQSYDEGGICRRAAGAAVGEALQIDDLLAGADSLAGKEVWIEGVCTHACKHGARKIFLMGSDDTQTIRVESGKLGKFDPQCVGSIVRVKGILREQRVDEDYLRSWEEQVRTQAGEQHGTTAAGCDSEKKARGETAATVEGRIADFRQDRRTECGRRETLSVVLFRRGAVV